MKININKEVFLEKLSLASRFTSSRLSSLVVLQGVLLESKDDKLHFFSTNLSSYYHTFIKIKPEKENMRIVIEPKKIVEFLSLLPTGNLEMEIEAKQILISLGKTKGTFSILPADEFPLPPKMEKEEQKIKAEFLTSNLPLILFAASRDETRPALTGVNFVARDDDMIMVATDGFRLSLTKVKKAIQIPSMIIPSGFLDEVIRLVKNEDIYFGYSESEKTISIRSGENDFYSRLVEGEFPPFEKVIPAEKTTTVVLDKEEFLRNVKLISVFARELSSIIMLQVNKDGVFLKPKTDSAGQNITFQEGKTEGEDQRVAFNYRFLLDFLNHVKSKQVAVEIVRSDAPVVFRPTGMPDFIHIIMPVRIQE